MTPAEPLIGWIGLDAPLEVLAAVGRPMRLEADPAASSPLASPFGEGGGHPAMRATAGRVLAEANTLQRIIIGSTPVTGVWLYNFLLTLARGPHAPTLPPMNLVNISHESRASGARLNRESIGLLSLRLGAGPGALRKAIVERNAVRSLQRQIDSLRHGDHRPLAGSAARRLLDAADRMAFPDYVGLAENALTLARSARPLELAPVIYSGPGSPSLDLYVALEAQGLTVVGDDADFGSRAIGPDVEESLEPAEAIARRYADRSPAPAGWSTLRRVEWLTDFVKSRRAEAVIFDLPLWAHPPAWDFPAERRALEAMGVACIVAPPCPPAAAAAAVAEALRTHQAGRQAHV